MFGFSALGLDKEGRLNYGESLMTHAMLITAFHKVRLTGFKGSWTRFELKMCNFLIFSFSISRMVI